jgi:phosphoribosylamine--glycine ligase
MARSPSVAEIIVAPGNAGLPERAGDASLGERDREEHGSVAKIIRRAAMPSSITPAAAVELATREGADLVVVGPEAPLCAGVADALEDAGVAVFGPRRDAAILEGSKAFLKRFASRHRIPTAPYAIVSSLEEAERAIRERGAPIVVKADGLCAGKGVVVAATEDEAIEAARAMLELRRFGDAGATVILEDLVRGEEVSVHAISDGRDLLVLPAARDHKRVGDGDTGPNTGGMGAFAPSALVTAAMSARIEREILRPTIDGMRDEGRPFRGVLFAGLMITPAGDPVLLEHNVRFGDPECEVLTALIDGDLAELFASAARGSLNRRAVHVAEDRRALTVILAASGYPESPRTGDVITGIERAEAIDGVLVHHAGTAEKDGRLVTSGGRVLAVTAIGGSLIEARDKAYRAAQEITFDGAHMRRDIGATAGLDRPL